MNPTLLSQIALSYSPVVDRSQTVIATRLTVLPRNPRVLPDMHELLALLAQIWPSGNDQVLLRLGSGTLLKQLHQTAPADSVMVEMPAAFVADPVGARLAQDLHANGNTLLLRHSAGQALPAPLQTPFKYVIAKAAENTNGAVARDYPGLDWMLSGARSLREMQGGFANGAALVTGWPWPTALPDAGKAPEVRSNMQVVLELIQGVNNNEPIAQLESVLYRDPALAFKLIRYINSAAFGLTAEIDSFSHAIMLLGYKNLKRWLALLLATADEDASLRPVSFAAMRRGLMMERLAMKSGSDEQTRNELFICGVFSLLDRAFKQPFETLLRTIFVSDPVQRALIEGKGPFSPYLRLVCAVEAGSWTVMRKCCDELLLDLGDVNDALLQSLATAHKMS